MTQKDVDSFTQVGDLSWHDPESVACAPDGSTNSSSAGLIQASKVVPTSLPANASIERKIAQTLIVGFSPKEKEQALSLANQYGIGGIFIVETTNADGEGFDKSFFSQLDTAAGVRLTIASDEEGGQIQRYNDSPNVGAYPSAKELGSKLTPEVEASAKELGTKLRAVGVTTNLAPDLDIDGGSAAVVIKDASRSRAFSDDPAVISEQAGAFASGLQAAGISPVYKHFPGHGRAAGNSDNGVVTTPSLTELKKLDLKPYAKLANQHGGAVMLGNLNVPGLTKNKEVTSTSLATVNLLREDYGFKGAITTDDLNAPSVTSQVGSMDTIIAKSLNAGVDMPLFRWQNGMDMQTIIDTVKKTVPVAKIDAAVAQVASFKKSIDTPLASSDGQIDQYGCCGASSGFAASDTSSFGAFNPVPKATTYWQNNKSKIGENASLYQQAAKAENVADWEVFAGLHRVETNLSKTNITNSYGYMTIYQMGSSEISGAGGSPSDPRLANGHLLTDDEFVYVTTLAAKVLKGKAEALKIDMSKPMTPLQMAKVTAAWNTGQASSWITEPGKIDRMPFAWAGYDANHPIPMSYEQGTIADPGAVTIAAFIKSQGGISTASLTDGCASSDFVSGAADNPKLNPGQNSADAIRFSKEILAKENTNFVLYAGAKADLVNTSEGKETVACGHGKLLHSQLLATLLKTSQKYQITIGNMIRQGCEHLHPAGWAADIMAIADMSNVKNKSTFCVREENSTRCANPELDRKFLDELAKNAPPGAIVNQTGCAGRNRSVGPSNVQLWPGDTCDHEHINVNQDISGGEWPPLVNY